MRLIGICLYCLVATTVCAQVIYQDKCPNGICQSVTIRTEPGKVEIIPEPVTEDKEIKLTTCVETDEGCVPSRHFITTITEPVS
jgi:hypothetical protein